MHSLHHSAETLTAVTGARHFWLEDPLISAALPVLGIIFKVPPEMVTPLALLYLLPDGLAHRNVRRSLGRFALVINNPQFHRIHHSVEPQHWNKNFCKMLALFDVIFGTAWKPRKDEFPKTGLVPREKATGCLDWIIWSVRHKLPVQRLNQFFVTDKKKYRPSDTGHLRTLLIFFGLDLVTNFFRIHTVFGRLE